MKRDRSMNKISYKHSLTIWLLIEGRFDRKSIKISSVNHSIYVNNQVFGRVVNSQFQRTNNYHLNPPPPANHMDDTTLAASSHSSESHDQIDQMVMVEYFRLH